MGDITIFGDYKKNNLSIYEKSITKIYVKIHVFYWSFNFKL